MIPSVKFLRSIRSIRRVLIVIALGYWIYLLIYILARPGRRWIAVSNHLPHRTIVTIQKPLVRIPLNSGKTPLILISAYCDPRLPSLVRVLAVGRVKPLPQLSCRMGDFNNTVFPTVPAISVTPILKNASSLFDEPIIDGLFIDCPFPPSTPSCPHFVAVAATVSSWSGRRSFLRVREVPAHPPESPTLAACVSPLHGNSSWVSPRHLVAWIEMNRLLGVERFIFYNYSAPASLQPLFRHYARVGLVDMLQWHPASIPTAESGVWPPPQHQLHYFGQFFVYNECLYRVLHRYRFAMFVDLDELLVPSTPRRRLTHLLSSLDTKRKSAFVFRASYLPTYFQQESDHRDILFLKFARREQRVLSQHVGPKLVVKPHLVLKMGIHELLQEVGFQAGRASMQTRVLTAAEGLLMHYRNPPRNLQMKERAWTRDERVLLFRNQLVSNVERTLRQLENRLAEGAGRRQRISTSKRAL